MFLHTAVHNDVSYIRKSKTNRYEFLLVGRRWKSFERYYIGPKGALRSRKHGYYKVAIDESDGVESEWVQIGWSRDRKIAESRRATCINCQGYAEVVLVPATVEERSVSHTRRWRLRFYVAVRPSEIKSHDTSDNRFLLIAKGRARSFMDTSDALRTARTSMKSGQCDAWELYDYSNPTVVNSVSIRGRTEDYRSDARWWDRKVDRWHNHVDWFGSISDRGGLDALPGRQRSAYR